MIKNGKLSSISGDLQLLVRVLVREVIYWATVILVYVILTFLQKNLELWSSWLSVTKKKKKIGWES